MAPLPIIANVYRVAIIHDDGAGNKAVNVIHISAPGSTTSDVLDEVDSLGTSDMWGALWAGFGLTDLAVTKLDGTSATIQRAVTTPTNWDGGGSGDPVFQAAAILKLETDLRGRSNRGRIFIGPVSESQAQSGFMAFSTRTAMTAAWVAFANALVADTMALGVASYLHANWHQATNIAMENALGTQRRRQSRLR